MSLLNGEERLNIPFVMVIFGATGDLTKRKLVPALFDLYQANLMPDQFTVLGFARRDWTAEDFSIEAGKFTSGSEEKQQDFFTNFDYLQGDFDNPADYKKLEAKLKELDDAVGQCGRRLFYLATPADSYDKILKGIKQASLEMPCGEDESWTRIVLEKPFGSNLVTAEALDQQLTEVFTEEQIYRIDHYLAKETAQNILTFRFANAIFEPIWNAEHINSITIEMRETEGIGTRGNFYEKTGAVRDVIQNHLLQLLALVTMEEPASMNASGFRDARANLLQAVCCFDLENLREHLVVGQYKSYTDEANVSVDSTTETFAAMRVEVHNDRWQGVPVYLLAGKRLERQETKITVKFKAPKEQLYALEIRGRKYNELIFNIQPQEGITLELLAKQPGYKNEVKPVMMHFDYHENFNRQSADAYSRLLLDAINGDQTLFTRQDEVKAEWQFIDPIVSKMAELHLKPVQYTDGSGGPKEAEQLLSSG